jgi:alpha-ketoglutarate-dependent taurine dioxygenase
MAAFESLGLASLLIRPVAGRIGAEVSGLRLSGDLDPVTVDAVRSSLYRFKVLFFRGQEHLDEHGQEAFGRLLGELVPHPTIPSLKGTQNVLDVDDATGARASAWHTDVTFVDAYPQISILRALVVPAYGGDTVWANTAAAYQSLTPQLRDLADNLWALHSNRSDYGGYPTSKPQALHRYHEVFTSTVYETQHPLVRVHPGTGERTLVLGHFVRRIVGVSPADSAHLMALFQGHITRLENTVRWRWAVGDVAMWDNRATQHSAVDDYGDQPRTLRRVTVAGDVPVSVDGKSSVLRRKITPPPTTTHDLSERKAENS